MTRHAAAFLASLALVAFALATRAQETPTPRPPRPGPYEFRVLALEYREYRESAEWKETLARHEDNAIKADAAFKEWVLNNQSRDGWELLQVVQPKNELTLLYLRRTPR